MWSVVDFGKFRGKGKTLPQIMFTDPDWFYYLMERGGFENKGPLASEAQDIYRKSRCIKIPNNTGKELEAEYYIHPPTRKFGGVSVVQKTQGLHEGASPAWRRNVFDMTVPRSISEYDKTGNEIHIKNMKYWLFGKENARITKKRAEDFFSNSDNFDL